jgi:hypothetical protein
VAAVRKPVPVEAAAPAPSETPAPEVPAAELVPPKPAPRRPPALAAPPVAEPAPEPAVEPAPAPVVTAAPPPPPIVTDAQLSEEIASVSLAQTFLRDGKSEDALQALDDHDRRFGTRARMFEEVIAARIAALCALGRADAARAELEKLPKGSVYQAKLGHACW